MNNTICSQNLATSVFSRKSTGNRSFYYVFRVRSPKDHNFANKQLSYAKLRDQRYRVNYHAFRPPVCPELYRLLL